MTKPDFECPLCKIDPDPRFLRSLRIDRGNGEEQVTVLLTREQSEELDRKLKALEEEHARAECDQKV